MSIKIDDPQTVRFKKHKKLKEGSTVPHEKKRKRNTSTDLELASPTKKHRSKQQLESTKDFDPSSINPDITTAAASSFNQQRSSLYLPLPPISQKFALKGLCAEFLSPLILTYYPPLNGVVISYSNCRLSTDPDSGTCRPLAKAIDEYAASFVWLTADFLIFRPQKGNVIEGWINLQSESNVGLLCLNLFNATIERRRLPKKWKWISGVRKPTRKRKLKKGVGSASTDVDEDSEDERGMDEDIAEDTQGYYQDERGQKVEGLLRFRVTSIETSRSMDRETSFLNLKGTLLDEEGEREIQEQELSRLRDRQETSKECYERCIDARL